MAQPLMPPFRIWFDGLDATDHQMDMEYLGESLQGLSQILRASAHFSLRHEYVKRRDKAYVRVLIEPPRPGTWWADAVAVAATQYPLLLPLAENMLWDMSLAVARSILFKRSGRRDVNERIMGLLEITLERQDIRDAATRDGLFGVIDRLINSYQPSAKKTVMPIGISCNAMRVGEDEMIDEAMADAITSPEDMEVMDERQYTVRIDSITLHTRACKVEIEGDEGRYVSAKITDPVLMIPGNVYTSALNERALVVVRAKPTMKRGALHQLYISHAERRG